MVEGVGFEPTKALGRLIYSQLLLTTQTPLRKKCAYRPFFLSFIGIGQVAMSSPIPLSPHRARTRCYLGYSNRIGADVSVWSVPVAQCLPLTQTCLNELPLRPWVGDFLFTLDFR